MLALVHKHINTGKREMKKKETFHLFEGGGGHRSDQS